MQVEVVRNLVFPRDLAAVFGEDDMFLGVYECTDYRLTRKFIEGTGPAMRLYYNHMEPLKEVKRASLCIIHGFGEHSSKFLDFGEYFVLRGFDVHFIDLRGFGYSGGARGVSIVEDMLSDIEMCIRQADEDLPMYLFGHSLGGLLVTSLGARNPHLKLAGIIANAPLLGLPKDRNIDGFKIFALKCVGDFLGDIVANSMINLTALTKSARFLRIALEDKLMIPFLGAKMAKSMLWAIEIIQEDAQHFRHPIYVMHGTEDYVTSPLDSLKFYQNCISLDKDVKLFEGGYHQMQHDQQVDEVQSLMLKWMEDRLPKSVKLYHSSYKFILRSPIQDNYFANLRRKLKILFFALFYFFLLIRVSRRFPYSPLWRRIIFPYIFK